MKMFHAACVWLSCFVIQSVYIGASKTRTYYIAAVERKWDYAPSGYNKVKGIKLEDDSNAAVFTTKGNNTIGRVYWKILYREYEDATFKTEKPHPPYLGFLGPIVKGEVGDTILVQFKNMANRNFSVHPHGVFYTKDSEGALYTDETKGADKKDDHVPPGGSHVYTWRITNSHAPAKDDDDCLTWIYHSHLLPHKDINSGLIGILLTCKTGTLQPSEDKAKGVDKEFVSLFTVLDENDSWLLDKNIQAFCSDPSGVNKEDEDFMESNKMHAINGYFYGNLPGLEMCLGDSVNWNLAGIGNEVDLHTAYFHGQTFTIDAHRKDVASLLPATFVTASMKALNPGTWMLNCLVNDHYNAGMYALFNVTKCDGKSGHVPIVSGGKKRSYYIAANEVTWNYGPTGMNNMNGDSLTKPESDSAVFFTQGDQRIGGTYLKAIYEEYTSSSFTTKKTDKPAHLGFLGPVIRAEVGDVIEVVFKNNARHNYSIQPHGVFFNKSNEGALYQDHTSGAQKADDIVQPGQMYTYRWTVPEEVGPTSDDVQCITWLYYSSVDPVKDTYSGLFGPLLTCKKGSLNNDNTQKNISKEFVLLFTVTDESESWYHEENKKRAKKPDQINDDDEDYLESNKMHGINGYLYANLPGLNMCLGEKVSWHLIGLGNEVDMHTAYFYGNTFIHDGNVKDTLSLLPGLFATLRMTPDNAGEWALVCRTNDHYSAGMQAKYTVQKNCGTAPTMELTGKTRRYYIAAEEVEWDYAPTGEDVLGGMPLEKSDEANTFTTNGDKRIGRKYKKVVYREYNSAQFKVQKKRTAAEQHLGVLGPMLHAEVGDTIVVVFKNNAAGRFSMHPHGLHYSKGNEGSNYKDGTRGASQADNAVDPGKLYTYSWNVPERAGPGPNGPSCTAWAYYSDVNPIKDTNSGLVGPLIVCNKDTLTGNVRKDVDREFAIMFTVLDENESWYLDKNIDTYCKNPGNKETLKADADFQESNKMHGINGFVFGNLKGLEMFQNEKVEWYLVGIGNEVDMHTVHFHGQTFLHKRVAYHREDVYDLFPGVFATVEMIPDSVGVWMLHCHVNDHMTGGMETVYTVYDESLKTTIHSEDPSSTANLPVSSGFIISLLLAVFVTLVK